jgi:hypothetical protein
VFEDPIQANTDHHQQNQTNTHASNAKLHFQQHLHVPNKKKNINQQTNQPTNKQTKQQSK